MIERFKNQKGEIVIITKMSDYYLLNAYKYFKGRALLLSLEYNRIKPTINYKSGPSNFVDQDDYDEEMLEDTIENLKDLITSLKHQINKRKL